ncbi:hypothetical protein [Frigidibacter oleivorans]|uniref:hypothetical protein n=1 Tax=Frigidibacter oleivorans TaxID=2487129 RepID=UPI000F8C4F5E|nr:hypothetical protein [Frigidibacter oleivorans]
MADRLRCCIPFCRRTHHNREGFGEWICQKHWSAVPKAMRRAYASAKRRRKPGEAISRIWARCRRAAADQAMMWPR